MADPHEHPRTIFALGSHSLHGIPDAGARGHALVRSHATTASTLHVLDAVTLTGRTNAGRVSQHRSRGQLSRGSWAAKLSVASLALALLVETAGLCLCLPLYRAASGGANDCCLGPTAPHAHETHGASTASVQALESQCCAQSLSALVLRAEQREPVAASWACEGVHSLRPAAPASAGTVVASRHVPSSAPRSPVLRI